MYFASTWPRGLSRLARVESGNMGLASFIAPLFRDYQRYRLWNTVSIRSVIPFSSGASLWHQFAYLHGYLLFQQNWSLLFPRPLLLFTVIVCGCCGRQTSKDLFINYVKQGRYCRLGNFIWRNLLWRSLIFTNCWKRGGGDFLPLHGCVHVADLIRNSGQQFNDVWLLATGSGQWKWSEIRFQGWDSSYWRISVRSRSRVQSPHERYYFLESKCTASSTYSRKTA